MKEESTKVSPPAPAGKCQVKREDFLAALESVQPGLSQRDVVEQSSCFVFRNGRVLTFNDEVACKAPSLLPKEITGAVKADPLLFMLQKLTEDVVQVEADGEHLIVKGKRKSASFRLEAEILLQVDSVDKPEEWAKLPAQFGEAVGVVQLCASDDQSRFDLTCVHVHPKWLEASSEFQICRWKIKTPVKEATLVKQSSIKHVASLGMTEVSETPAWLHFRNASGLILSCRRSMDPYPELDEHLEAKGAVNEVTLPKALVEAADRASVAANDNDDTNKFVVVDLKPGRLRVKGEGPFCSYNESKKVNYDGEPLLFLISPTLLTDIVNRHSKCVVGPGILKVDAGSYVYCACLGETGDDGKAAPDSSDGEEGGGESDEGEKPRRKRRTEEE